MNEILKKVKLMAKEKADSLNLKLISVEWVNEYGTNILRIIADSTDGLTIDESTNLNELISDELDKLDLIKDEYMLEVSSPGIERELATIDEVKMSIGEYVHIDFYKHYEINKQIKVLELEGTLKDVIDDEKLIVVYNNRGQIKNLEIEKDLIKLIRLAIKF